ncbi:MAG: hypothetical protein M0R77_00560 [Gammaproteobacteria bacterium]|nr:hypothetical protein [Acholeplasmataceae bacterium]MCK9529045.1 hypothetical protein [Gammaproteobacteria bacterium]
MSILKVFKKQDRSTLPVAVSKKINFNLPTVNVHKLGDDGEDHINIHPIYAETELGKMLSMHDYTPFTHPVLGTFSTLIGYWFYIKTKGMSDDFRLGRDGKAFRKKAGEMQQFRLENFQEYILDGYYEMISQNENVKELFLASTLPFTQYWISSKVRAVPPGLEFINSGLHSLRENMKLGIEPDRPDFVRDFKELIRY